MSGKIGSAGANEGKLGETELDYEEGTWTPSFSGTTTGFSGEYTKIGNVVRCSVWTWSNQGSNITNCIISGLPFTSLRHCTFTFQRTRHSSATVPHWGVIDAGGTTLGLMAAGTTIWSNYAASQGNYTLVSGGAVVLAWEFTYHV